MFLRYYEIATVVTGNGYHVAEVSYDSDPDIQQYSILFGWQSSVNSRMYNSRLSTEIEEQINIRLTEFDHNLNTPEKVAEIISLAFGPKWASTYFSSPPAVAMATLSSEIRTLGVVWTGLYTMRENSVQMP